ncbi:sulfotransferase [Pseudoalteromonas xiamenensis]|uniref:Sulfotransferase family protein n=1 Tax=Pseudoalteromonas xiamenensis TaxID=882626 RepID=A0A975HL31_9GAMM|nr:sulfotransferase [Pseudoalteromonas xiamenensis]QTH71666.1 sulfotransferase family protein [Pseudoalteromonas xiamenensis]
MNSKKTLIVGLPRTGTTSLCALTLQLGYKTAHTAYTQKTFLEAEVIADTPIFCDYGKLATYFENTQLILLQREQTEWAISVSTLLKRMAKNLLSQQGGFNDTIKRAYFEIFPELTFELISDLNYLVECYEKHQREVFKFANLNNLPLLTLNVQTDGINRLTEFLPNKTSQHINAFPHLNQNGKVTAWKDVNHPLKIESTNLGKAEKDSLLYQFFSEVKDV